MRAVRGASLACAAIAAGFLTASASAGPVLRFGCGSTQPSSLRGEHTAQTGETWTCDLIALDKFDAQTDA